MSLIATLVVQVITTQDNNTENIFFGTIFQIYGQSCIMT